MNNNRNNDVNLGRFISLILRHQPETIGITLDKEGWADTQELLDGINTMIGLAIGTLIFCAAPTVILIVLHNCK